MHNTKYIILNTLRRLRLHTWIGIGLMIILLPIIILMLYKPQGAIASWYDDRFIYRTPITFNNSGAAVTNQKVKFDIDTATLITAGKMQSDCADVRFTNSDGKLLRFYIDAGTADCNNASTDFYVLFPNIAADDNVAYLYYGNPSAVNIEEAAQFSEATFSTTPSTGTEEDGPGPVAHWSFDEATDNTCANGTDDVCDKSSYNSDGAKTGAIWIPEDRCIKGTCIYFDGTGDNVNFGDKAQFDNTDELSISFWLRVPDISDQTNARTKIFYKVGASGDRAYQITFGQSADLVCDQVSGACMSFDIFRNDGTTRDRRVNIDASKMTDAKWHHFAFTYSTGDDYVAAYLDGKLEQARIVDDTTGFKNTTASLCMADDCAAANIYTGFMDEVKIFRYPLTADQVLQEYNEGAAASFGSQNQISLSDGLIAYWKMDETSVNTCDGGINDTCDSSGSGFDGTWNGSYVGGGAGKYGDGIRFDANGDYVSYADNGLSSDNATYSIWVKSDSATNPSDIKGIITKSTTTANFDREIEVYFETNGTINALTGDNSSQNGILDLSTVDYYDANWHHVVVVKEATSTGENIYGYIDGKLAGTRTNSFTTVQNSTALQLGRVTSNSTAARYFPGNMDEFRVYNRALSSEEIRDLYNWAPGPIAHYPLDENTGSTIYDRSGNGYSGTLNNSGWVSCQFGPCISSSATNSSTDGMEVADPASGDLDFDNTQDYTTSVWVKISNQEGNTPIVYKGGAANNDIGYSTQVLSSTGVASCQYTDGNASGIDQADGTSVVNDGQWHHIECVMDRTGDATGTAGLYVYVDSVLEGSDTSLTEGDGSNTKTFDAGEPYNSGVEFNGAVDDVRVYRYARTPGQIIEDMNAGHPLGGSPVGSQSIYYRFDEGYGTTANDVVENQNGTISGATWNTEDNCKIGKCLTFDAASEAVTIATANDSQVDFGPSEAFSGSAWIYVTTMPTSTGSDKDAIITKWDDNNNLSAYRIYVENDDDDSTGNIEVEIYDESASQPLTATGPLDQIAVNTWYHVGWTFNGGTSGTAGDLKLYVDGYNHAENSANGSFLGIEDLASDFVIGEYDTGDSQGANTPFTGRIDEVQIFSGELSQEEMRIVYNSGATSFGVLGSTEAAAGVDGSGNPPIAYWNFDENTGSGTDAVKDTSGNNNHGDTQGTINNNSWIKGKFGSAMTFNGTSDGILIGDAVEPVSAITVMAWVKPAALGTSQEIIGKWGATSGERSYLLSTDDGDSNEFTFAVGQSTNADVCDSNSTQGTFTPGEWVWVAGRYTGGNCVIYVNGINVTDVVSTSANGNINNSSTDLGIGYRASASSNYFQGEIDEVKVFDYALTRSQLSYHYFRGSPVHHYRLDECQGDVAYDSGPFKANGAINIGGSGTHATEGTCNSGTASEAWNVGTTGKFGSSLGFDFTDDYIEVSDPDMSTGDFTLTAWVYLDSSQTGGTYIFHNPDNSGNNEMTLYVNQDGNLSYQTNNNSSVIATESFPTGEWVHVALTRDTSSINSWQNGKIVGSSSDGTEFTFASGGTQCSFFIGVDIDSGACGSSGGLSNYWDGLIDDVTVFHYALSAAQIRKVMNDSSAARFGPNGGSP